MTPFILAVDIRELAPRADALAELLPEARREGMRRFRLPGDRLRSLAAGLLIRETAAGRPVELGDFGKPHVDGGPFFNVSHSGDYAVMAVAGTPVGADVEVHRDDDFAALAEISFHPDERRALADNYSRAFFYDLWTLKESYCKMLGSGFSLDPAGFCLQLDSVAPRLAVPVGTGAAFKLYHDLPGYSLAVCVQSGDLPVALTWFHP